MPKSRDPEVALSELSARLREAEEALAAIRTGAVDAIVVEGPEGEKVFSLAGAEHPYRLMIERMNQGAAMLRDDGTIIFCNAALARMFGSEPETVAGVNIRAFACLEVQESLESVLRRGRDGDGRQEVRLRHGETGEVPVLLAVSNLGPENAERLCLLATDLSEQKRREQELERSHRLVSEYAADLHRSNQDLQDFATIAGHDLRQPLRKVSLLAGQLQETCGAQLGPDGRHVAERLAASAQRMHQLVEGLLSYSQIQRKKDLPARVSLDRVVEEVLADLEVPLRDAGAQVHAGPLPELEGDETQLRQLLQNLISNALKYRRPEVASEISIACEPASGGMVEIRVRDNGSGFDMRQAENIFRPFHRLVSEAECPGIGMGLAICRRIAARHGGDIRAQSEPGAGSMFVVRLPLRQPPREEGAEAGDVHAEPNR